MLKDSNLKVYRLEDGGLLYKAFDAESGEPVADTPFLKLEDENVGDVGCALAYGWFIEKLEPLGYRVKEVALAEEVEVTD